MFNNLKRISALLLILVLLPYSGVFAYTEQQNAIKVYDYSSYVEAIKESILSNKNSVTLQISNYNNDIYDYNKAINQIRQESPEVNYMLDRSSSSGSITNNTATLQITLTYKNTMKDLAKVEQVNNYNDYYTVMKNALFDFEDKILVKISNYNSTVYNTSETLTRIKNDCYDIRYGINGTRVSTYGEGKDKVLEITFIYDFSRKTMLKMREEVNEKTQQIISEVIKPGMKDYEKELVLHDYVVNHSKYDTDNFNRNTVPAEGHTAYGVLIQGTGVCDGYAEAMRKLLTSVGIECKVVTGYGNNENHAWNIVKIQNQYYMLDATWDDPVSTRDILSHEYFNVTDKKLSKDHKWEKGDLPECSSTDYSYENIIKILSNSSSETEDSSKDQSVDSEKEDSTKDPQDEVEDDNDEQPDTPDRDTDTEDIDEESDVDENEFEGIKYVMDSVALFIDDSRAYVKGNKRAIDNKNLDVVPVVVDGRTLVPARFIAESFGAEVKWDEFTSQITIIYGDSTARLKLESDIMDINGQAVKLSVPAQTINNRTMIPLRSLAEDLMGKKVFYEDNLIVIGDDKEVSNLQQNSISLLFVQGLFRDTELLKNDDIRFTVNGKTYFFNHPKAEELFEQLGDGNADENNNYGFVGWDSEYNYKIYRNGYPAKDPQVFVYSKMDVIDGKTVITDIDISGIGTVRGLKAGDSYNKMKFVYNAPYSTKDLGNGSFECMYAFSSDTRLAFYFDSATNCITAIRIIFTQ